ncbi:MAG: SH3 domain-containing protein [bacterium]|nr:SH3 domain-containing protein [bacterium]
MFKHRWGGLPQWIAGMMMVLLAVAATSASSLLPVLADSHTVTANVNARVRSGPGTQYSILGLLFEGETAAVTGRSGTDNAWYRIDFEDGEGWISSSVVSIDDDPTTLDIVEASNADEGETSDVTAYLYEEVNVRIGPATSYRAIAQAYDVTVTVTGYNGLSTRNVCQGNSVIDIVTGEAPEDVWLRIQYEGAEAWVSYAAVTVNGNLCALDEVGISDDLAEASEEAEALADSVYVLTTDSVNLRASNFASSDVLAVIPADELLEAEARNDDSTRVRVTYNDQTGWIATAFVTVQFGTIDDLSSEQE